MPTSRDNWRIPLLFFLVISISMAHSASLSLAASLPPGQSLLPTSGLAAFTLQGLQKQLGNLQIVTVDHPNFKQAARIQTAQGSTTDWNVQIVSPITADVKSGDVLLGHFWLRCDESMTGEGFTTFIFESTQRDFDKGAEFKISSGNKWREVFVPFQATEDFPAAETRVAFRAGFDAQTIEIAGMEVINFKSAIKLEHLPHTDITYVGREPNAQWRKEALDRIEKIRKGDLSISLVDSSGAPLASAHVHAVLRRHAFGFGTCVDTGLLLGKSPDSIHYQQTVASYFNRAVFENDMKWPPLWNGVPPRVDQAMQWLRDHNIPVRGHNLVWPGWKWLPPQLKSFRNDPQKLRDLTAHHITRVVTHFRGQLLDWDVVNENFTNHDLIDLLGGPAIMIDWYKLARAADPDVKLFINDFGIFDGGTSNAHRQFYYDTIKYLKDHGAPLDGIGIQSHFGTELPAPTDLLKVLDQFASFGLPIESTEVSINLVDRKLQADYLRDYTIALFSHPAVRDVMLWGFWTKRHWRPQAALFDDDWTPRPAAQAWIDLTQKQWMTDVTTNTNNRGIAAIRGFFGTYDVTVSSGSKTKTVSAEIVPGGTHLTLRME